ncbi:MAG: ABC transporter substrate-binding protein [Burkholderiales bacterium]|nr:ABC transporter substrate-binding protein [Burkholderiales bacterium]
MRFLSKLTYALLIVTAGMSQLAFSANFNWASQGDITTFDPHSESESFKNMAVALVYEGLVRYDKDNKIEPALAESWEVVPEGFLFKIREGVKFHEGQPLTPEDVVYSLKRAAFAQMSQFKPYAAGITDVVLQPDGRVLVKTSTLSPVILNQLTLLKIMNKDWSKEHKVLEPQDFAGQEESFTVNHANGTGPFKLKSREVDVKTVFERNKDWWDEPNRVGNVDISNYTPIQSGATRTAALLSGQIDFVLDPAPQDIQRLKKTPNIKVMEMPELRTIMIMLDQFQDQSPYIKVDGKPTDKNPFKDKRVRQALYQAVDIEALKKNVMRGASEPIGTIIASSVNGWSEKANQRLPYDLDNAKKLLAEAGYPNGFEFVLDTSNNRWVNDESIAKALAAMWAKIGLKVHVNAMPRSIYFPKIERFDTSASMMGWTPATLDALIAIQPLVGTYDLQKGYGLANPGRVSDPEIDKLIEKITIEPDAVKRNQYIEDALMLIKENVYVLPLHTQYLTWAMKKNIDIPQRADNYVLLDKVKVQ